MAPKKKPVEGTQNAAVFNEVDKAMFELTIADLNRKLARLRVALQEYEQKNEQLQEAYDNLDEDRADVIAYLKKSLNTKTEENIEMKDRIKALEELREEETKEFKEKVQELEKNFNTMKAQLTSENKLYAGKINTLEEFRATRDDLMQKFEHQDQSFRNQEMKYKRLLYDAEKKFIIGKDKLKKEMEARLLGLAQDFQDASESRIAASTHRVIRENIALNNQLDNLLMTQAKVADQNEKLKESQLSAHIAMEVAEAERDKAINKSITQLKVIDRLTIAYQNIQKTQAMYERKELDNERLQTSVEKLRKENEKMVLQIRVLEQNLHAATSNQNKQLIESTKLIRERDKYKRVIKETTSVVQSALKRDQWATLDPTRELLERQVVFKNILSVLCKHRFAVQPESMESLVSFSDVYEKGDLGFIPKSKVPKSKLSLIQTESSESFGAKRSSATSTSTESSVVTLKTIPSMELMPKTEAPSTISTKESIPSFTVTSPHSTLESEVVENEDPFEAMTDLEKQLAMSKLEIQRSILKDLAMTQTTSLTFDTTSSTDIKLKLDKIDSKLGLITTQTEAEGVPPLDTTTDTPVDKIPENLPADSAEDKVSEITNEKAAEDEEKKEKQTE